MASFFNTLLGRLRPGRRLAVAGAPRIPDGLRLYAVGDIHGEKRCLERLLAMIAADMDRHRGPDLRCTIVFLGDYVDRGPDSRGVLDLLCDAAAASADGSGPACRFLMGNHEQALLEFLRDPVAGAPWLSFGGVEALASYGIRASVGVSDPKRCRALRDEMEARLPAAHRGFLTALEPMAVYGDYAFVHAGVLPGQPLERQSADDLLWIREPFLSYRRRHEKMIVHGHTVVDEPELLDNRIGIDTGAYATGVLTALVLQGGERGILQTAP
ncbi:metallophosphoesterase family protein [Azospirillum thermophilum]|uniref:Serine/threonine protein phosphatase n=1 Tax=Azospirillum thermophilum TaxID=2202148 RepID=A0A2S2CL53_9PROT|nr:metallophosphoesterase family protein [Azospirillum thermophilum]AWK85186.1 serine/threonine protein phosphatase [Azospirillum thermophilum]